MDTQGIIREHSKIKLELYRLYLERYLSILFVTPYFGTITVNDVFAGSGISKNDEKGSAVIAAETIDTILKQGNPQHKKVSLNLNDSDAVNCAALREHLKIYNFVHVSQYAANDFIQKWRVLADSHNLHFIDPHGYTQVSIDNLKKLFGLERCEFLIFIPIFHIYRFLRKEGNEEQLKPIADFLSQLSIGESEAKSVENVEEFSDLVKVAFSKIAGTELVYGQMIDNQSHTSKYCLFFITKDYLGAQKFIEAQEQLKQKIKEGENQIHFAFVDDFDKPSLLNHIEFGTAYDNVEIYKIGIRSGILPKNMREELVELEKGGHITVTELVGKQRQRKGFYINHDMLKDQEKKISIIFRR